MQRAAGRVCVRGRAGCVGIGGVQMGASGREKELQRQASLAAWTSDGGGGGGHGGGDTLDAAKVASAREAYRAKLEARVDARVSPLKDEALPFSPRPSRARGENGGAGGEEEEEDDFEALERSVVAETPERRGAGGEGEGELGDSAAETQAALRSLDEAIGALKKLDEDGIEGDAPLVGARGGFLELESDEEGADAPVMSPAQGSGAILGQLESDDEDAPVTQGREESRARAVEMWRREAADKGGAPAPYVEPTVPVLVMEIDLGGASVAQLEVFSTSDPYEVAHAFCHKHHIAGHLIGPLAQKVRGQLEALPPEVQKRIREERAGAQLHALGVRPEDLHVLEEKEVSTTSSSGRGRRRSSSSVTSTPREKPQFNAFSGSRTPRDSVGRSALDRPPGWGYMDDYSFRPSISSASRKMLRAREREERKAADEVARYEENARRPASPPPLFDLREGARGRLSLVKAVEAAKAKAKWDKEHGAKPQLSARSQELAKARAMHLGHKSYHDKLYAEGMAKRKEREALEEAARRERAEAVDVEATFKPTISAMARGMRRTGDTLTARIVDPTGTNRLRQLEVQRAERAAAELEACSFSPAISERSRRLVKSRESARKAANMPFHESLYRDGERKMVLLKEKQAALDRQAQALAAVATTPSSTARPRTGGSPGGRSPGVGSVSPQGNGFRTPHRPSTTGAARKHAGAPPRTPEEEATVIMASLGLGRESAEIIF